MSLLLHSLGALFRLGVAFAYPAYESLKVLTTSDVNARPRYSDAVQWLSYWLIYSSTLFIEASLASIIPSAPTSPGTFFSIIRFFAFTISFFYTVLRQAFTMWLVLPQFRGATWVYEHGLNDMGERLGRVPALAQERLEPYVREAVKRLSPSKRVLAQPTVVEGGAGPESRTPGLRTGAAGEPMGEGEIKEKIEGALGGVVDQVIRDTKAPHPGPLTAGLSGPSDEGVRARPVGARGEAGPPAEAHVTG